MSKKRIIGVVLGFIVAIAAAGIAVARWSGLKLEWWQTLLWIVALVGLAAVAFGFWVNGE